jgi:hypothetical protein
MTPTIKTSVIAFPHIEQRSALSRITIEEVERAVQLVAEDIRLNWLKAHAASPRVCARTRLVNAAMVSDLSDNAFRVLCLQLSYTNGTHLKTTVANETIAALARCNEKTVRRSNKELEAKRWMATKKRRRDGAEKTMAIPEEILAQIGTEIMEKFPPRLVVGGTNQEVSRPSLQEVLPVQNSVQDRTEMSTLDSYGKFQEWTEMSTQEVLPVQNSVQDRTEMSTLGYLDRTPEADSGVKTGHFWTSRLDKFGTIICKEEKYLKKIGGAEPDCIQSVRESAEAAQPPSVEDFLVSSAKVAAAIVAGLAGSLPAAAAPAEPPAIIQSAPEIPECWSTPEARQNAFLRAAEARAQREVSITPNGCLEAVGGFRAELEAKFPLVDLECGLMAAAPNAKPYMTAIETQAMVRRQFAYMQADAKRKADRDASFDKIRKATSGNDKRIEVPGLPGLYYGK